MTGGELFKLLTCFWTKRFQVLRADLERREFAAVDEVGDNVFFVGKNYSISVSVAEFPELILLIAFIGWELSLWGV